MASRHYSSGSNESLDQSPTRRRKSSEFSSGGRKRSVSESSSGGRKRSVSENEPTKFFKRKQLFVEMDELDGDEWKETHRWNFGLEEDLLDDEDHKPVWNHPHLPWVSVFGFMKLLEEMNEDGIVLDIEAKTYQDMVSQLVATIAARGQMPANKQTALRDVLLLHDKMFCEHYRTEERKAADVRVARESAINHIDHDAVTKAPSLHLSPHRNPTIITEEDASSSEETEPVINGIVRVDSVGASAVPVHRVPSMGMGTGLHEWHADSVLSAAPERKKSSLNKTLTVSAEHSPSNSAENSRSNTPLPSDGDEGSNDGADSDSSEEFALMLGEELEEAADILVGGVEWLEEDIVCFVRLKEPIDMRLERKAAARFFCLIIGPPKDRDCVRHREMAEALASMLQDEEVVEACFSAVNGRDVLDAFDMRMHKLTLLPHIHRPTTAGIKKIGEKMHKEMAAISGTDHRQLKRWDKRAEDLKLDEGLTFQKFLLGMQKYAIPLILGVVIAMVLKNVEADWYDLAFGAAHGDSHGDDGHGNATDHHLLGNGSNASVGMHHAGGDAGGDDHDAHGVGSGGHTNGTNHTDGQHNASHDGNHGDAHHDVVPTFFTLELHNHVVNLHFIVNDIFMCFFFGLATVEIVESFLPGAILYPPTKAAVNPLGATLGGVLGPIAIYIIILAIFDAAGAFDDLGPEFQFDALKVGWGIPTATDICIGWSAALIVFGKGHPAITYLLLLAIADDAIGMIIIAVAYPDPYNAFKPIWLLLVLGGMVLAFTMRKLKVLDWRLYILGPGAMSWYGLLQSTLHPALALAFIVPFMPTGDIKHDESKDGEKKAVTEIEMTWDATPDTNQLTDNHDHGAAAHAPLFEFSHAIKPFTDLFILFLFGLCNAGVDTSNGVGPFAWVIFLALLIGKVVGIGVTGIILHKCGFHFPGGMKIKHCIMVALIAGCGLTVSLFVAGEAFQDLEVQGQAKLGSLFSLAAAFFAIFLSMIFKFTDIEEIPKEEESTPFPGSEEEEATEEEEEDEFLEHMLAVNQVEQIRQIQHEVKQVERDHDISRAEVIQKYKTRKTMKLHSSRRGASGGDKKANASSEFPLNMASTLSGAAVSYFGAAAGLPARRVSDAGNGDHTTVNMNVIESTEV